jgi:WhiB family redox-sensing transcriptional regulator
MMQGVAVLVDQEPAVGRMWWERANCRGQSIELWVNAKNNTYKAQREICRACEVRDECLAFALRNPDTFGCWGGTNERERKRLRRLEVELRSPLVP